MSKNNMIPDVASVVQELRVQDKAVLDISTYPSLKLILETGKLHPYPSYYVPDTVAMLLSKGKQNNQYYYFAAKLFTRWTRRNIDFPTIDGFLSEKEPRRVNVKLITKEMVDTETYSLCYDNIVSKDLVIEMSPDFNLVGDVIGKMLGFAKKARVPILMMTRRLVRDVRGIIPVFEAANTLVHEKQEFFEKMIPGLRRTKGVRWIVGITIGTLVSPVGFTLAIVDP